MPSQRPGPALWRVAAEPSWVQSSSVPGGACASAWRVVACLAQGPPGPVASQTCLMSCTGGGSCWACGAGPQKCRGTDASQANLNLPHQEHLASWVSLRRFEVPIESTVSLLLLPEISKINYLRPNPGPRLCFLGNPTTLAYLFAGAYR